jgi:hypothetical protein
MGHMSCTEPQCLYKGALFLYMTIWNTVRLIRKGKEEISVI